MTTGNRLAVGEPCLAKLPGLSSPWFRAVVHSVLPKGYVVDRCQRMSGQPDLVTVSTLRCKRPELGLTKRKQAIKPKKQLNGERPPRVRPANLPADFGKVIADIEERLPSQITLREAKPQPKAPKPRRSPAYLAFVRSQKCCNCWALPPSDPDHNGKRGVGEKASDLLTIPLCRECHRIRTDKNCLPSPMDSQRKGKVVLRSGEETKDIISREQIRLMSAMLARLPLALQVEALERALSGVDESILSEAAK